jgi:hypothetical protein
VRLQHRGRVLAAQMVAWMQDFTYNCRELGLSDEQAAFSTADTAGTALLISEYASRTYEMLHNWSVNILQVGTGLPRSLHSCPSADVYHTFLQRLQLSSLIQALCRLML